MPDSSATGFSPENTVHTDDPSRNWMIPREISVRTHGSCNAVVIAAEGFPGDGDNTELLACALAEELDARAVINNTKYKSRENTSSEPGFVENIVGPGVSRIVIHEFWEPVADRIGQVTGAFGSSLLIAIGSPPGTGDDDVDGLGEIVMELDENGNGFDSETMHAVIESLEISLDRTDLRPMSVRSADPWENSIRGILHSQASQLCLHVRLHFAGVLESREDIDELAVRLADVIRHVPSYRSDRDIAPQDTDSTESGEAAASEATPFSDAESQEYQPESTVAQSDTIVAEPESEPPIATESDPHTTAADTVPTAPSSRLIEPAADEPDGQLVDQTIRFITRRFNLAAKSFEEIGERILKDFFDDDPERVSSRNPKKENSFRALCNHPDLPFSPTTLSNMVRIVLDRRFLADQGVDVTSLSQSCRVELLKLPEGPEKIMLAERAVRENLSVRALRALVDEIRYQDSSVKCLEPGFRGNYADHPFRLLGDDLKMQFLSDPENLSRLKPSVRIKLLSDIEAVRRKLADYDETLEHVVLELESLNRQDTPEE